MGAAHQAWPDGLASGPQMLSGLLRRTLCSSSSRLNNSVAAMASQAWDGTGTQDDFMRRDECLVVDKDDRVVGHNNKYACHQFNTPETPTGILHRAFSVFLFDASNRLLLQQRASEKITFPNVWTNTCCSHPLFGYTPSEVDQPEDVESGVTPGVKAAAVRKLLHELGISSEQLPVDQFRFLTRLHYCAEDSVTYGPGAPWGEHELDYILFIKATVDVHPNPEEVRDTKYVTLQELKEMMHPGSGLLWSPWFRIIAENFLDRWWADLDATLTTNEHVDTQTIHRLTV